MPCSAVMQAASPAWAGSGTADSRKGWGQLVPSSFQSYLIRSGDGPSPPLFVRILESAVQAAGAYSFLNTSGNGLERLIIKIAVAFPHTRLFHLGHLKRNRINNEPAVQARPHRSVCRRSRATAFALGAPDT